MGDDGAGVLDHPHHIGDGTGTPQTPVLARRLGGCLDIVKAGDRGVGEIDPGQLKPAVELFSQGVEPGLVVKDIGLFPRPTPLPTGMTGWLRTFRVSQFASIPAALAQQIEDEIVDLLRPSLCDTAGQWTADYVRLQVVAESPVTS